MPVEPSEQWQYAFETDDGIIAIEGNPRWWYKGLIRRKMVASGDWEHINPADLTKADIGQCPFCHDTNIFHCANRAYHDA